jgi:predicted homoserine dehydrogenase-like protein
MTGNAERSLALPGLDRGLSDEIGAFVAQRGAITVGVVGFGHMGSSLFAQLNRMAGLHPAAVSTSRPDEVRRFLHLRCGVDDDRVLETADPVLAAARIADGWTVITTDALMLPRIANLDVVVDATGKPELGARVGWASLEAGKHLATFNIEADSLFGSILRAKAQDRGMVYTGLSGDEPGAIMELYNFATLLAFDVVAVGKGKNNPLVPDCTPSAFANGVTGSPASVKSMCSFVDGTNTMIEMAAVANAIGFTPDIRGMHGPACTPADLSRTFAPVADGGILEHHHVVDYATGSIAPGVFAIVTADDPVVDGIMAYVGIDDGPYRALFRPYHLISLEAPIAIAEAAIRGRTTVASDSTQRTAEVIAVAKRDLAPGDRIDGIGGFAVRGVIEHYDVADAEDCVPVAVLEGAVVVRPVGKGEPLTKGDVELPGRSAARTLWDRQRTWLGAAGTRDHLVDATLRRPLAAEHRDG